MQFLKPNWPAPKWVHAATTLKVEGLDFSLNNQQRDLDCARLNMELQLPSDPIWLQQEHAGKVIIADNQQQLGAKNDRYPTQLPVADASFTNKIGVVCAVLTADCVPILLCDTKGTTVAAIHAGWRSQVAGIIENTVRSMPSKPEQLMAWIGPAIGGKVYEVGEEVYKEFCIAYGEVAMREMFTVTTSSTQKWLADLQLAARYILQTTGVLAPNIFGGEWCTYSDNAKFYSARQQDAGRMASLIWLEGNA